MDGIETLGRRDEGTKGRRDEGTKGRRDEETKRPKEKTKYCLVLK
jgi:hypothetical protein